MNDSRGVCNFNAATAQVGQFYPKSIVMVTGFKYGSSNKAKWVDLTCLDKKSKVLNLRVFDATVDATEASNIYSDYIGKYIRADIKYTNYGFQSELPELLPLSTAISPSVALAKSIVLEEIKSFPAIVDFVEKTQYIDKLEKIIAPEPGWSLVRIATLLNLINNVDNLVSGIDVNLMKKAAILSQLFMLPTKHKYADDVKTVLLLRQLPELGTDDELLSIMMNTEESTETEAVYKVIRDTAERIIDVRYLYGG